MKVKMAKDKYYGKTLRKNFARHEEVMPMPNLLEIQKTSYREFLDTGLREVFADVGAISDYQGNLELTFIDFRMDEAPKYNVEECKARDATYAAPLKVTVRLRNKETEEIKEQEIFMGDFPLMTTPAPSSSTARSAWWSLRSSALPACITARRSTLRPTCPSSPPR